jgi:hypothetical protein
MSWIAPSVAPSIELAISEGLRLRIELELIAFGHSEELLRDLTHTSRGLLGRNPDG